MAIYITLSAWILLLTTAKQNTILNNKFNSRVILFTFYILTSYLILSNIDKYLLGERFGDAIIYVREFSGYTALSLSQAFQLSNKEVFFTFFTWCISKITTSPYVYLSAVWLLISLTLIKAFRMIFDSNWKVLLTFYTYVNFPFFLSYVFNGIRQGFAMSFLTLAICLLMQDKKKANILFFTSIILASLSHTSAIPFALILLALKLFRISVKFSLIIWTLMSTLYITGLNKIFMFLSEYVSAIENYSSYSALAQFNGTNRIDFLLFSFFFLIIGLYLYRRTKKNKNYKQLLNAYILFNSVFLMLGFIAYSNRLSTYSWYLIPLVILYPFLDVPPEKKHNSLVIALVILISIVAINFGASYYLF